MNIQSKVDPVTVVSYVLNPVSMPVDTPPTSEIDRGCIVAWFCTRNMSMLYVQSSISDVDISPESQILCGSSLYISLIYESRFFPRDSVVDFVVMLAILTPRNLLSTAYSPSHSVVSILS